MTSAPASCMAGSSAVVPVPKWMRGTVFTHHVEGGCGVCLHVAAVVIFTEGACPGVED